MTDHKRHPEGKETEPARHDPQEPQAPLAQGSEGPDREEVVPALPGQDAQQLVQQLPALQADRDDLFARLQRLSADYSNYQKRVHKQIADAVAHEKETIVRSLLPLCDNFEMVLRSTGSGDNTEAIRAGVKIVYDQILDVLKGHDVEPINAADQPFDPVLHQALMQRCDPERQDNWVIEECQKGYTLAGRVLRPSKVIVNRAPAPKPDQAGSGVAKPPEETPDVE